MYKNLVLVGRSAMIRAAWKPNLMTVINAKVQRLGSARNESGAPKGKSDVIDIDVFEMAEADPNFARNFTTTTLSSQMQAEATVLEPDPNPVVEPVDEKKSSSVCDLDGLPLAPIDINPWADDEETKGGTVEAESIEIGEDKDDEYPPPPEYRAGEYQFKGIKVELPPYFWHEGTYRYRLDKNEQDLADDIRVCRFDK